MIMLVSSPKEMALQSTMKKSSGRSVLVVFVLIILVMSFLIRTTFRLRKQHRITEFLELCSLGSAQAIELIDREPVLLSVMDESGWSCLNNASKYNRLMLVKALLERGASTGTKSMKHTALRGASLFGYKDVVVTLLEAGAFVDVYSSHHRTPLMGAAMNGHKQVVETLLQAGANPELKNDDDMTALDLARQNGHADIVTLLERRKMSFSNSSISI